MERRKDYEEKIGNFLEDLKKRGIEKIFAFSGSVPKELEERAQRVVEDSFKILKNYPIAIQTGGTRFDIQLWAAEQSRKNKMPLIGIYPSRGIKYRLEGLNLDVEVMPRYGSSEWGDDTEIFSKLPHAVEVIGGSTGTLIEFGHLIKVNDSRIKEKKEPIYIAPIIFNGIKTSADLAYDFPLKPEQLTAFPQNKIIENGEMAAEYLLKRLKFIK